MKDRALNRASLPVRDEPLIWPVEQFRVSPKGNESSSAEVFLTRSAGSRACSKSKTFNKVFLTENKGRHLLHPPSVLQLSRIGDNALSEEITERLIAINALELAFSHLAAYVNDVWWPTVTMLAAYPALLPPETNCFVRQGRQLYTISLQPRTRHICTYRRYPCRAVGLHAVATLTGAADVWCEDTYLLSYLPETGTIHI